MYISQFISTWAVIYTDKFGQIVIKEYKTETEARTRLAILKG